MKRHLHEFLLLLLFLVIVERQCVIS